ncbi:glycoside hydrolase family 44 protein [Micromonospora mirobrigensis]|uniref:Fibronectin type III domain-containing protein n=1 Tax=Micromonospora mirobrigensis TaxID=262898 RepID=A0A1C5A7F8_9ACTN|nr:glycoside hydrolase family 44 protein [Micromonospora mirobrigensis]SCF41127.1 Fibronectin type III domain-containing protein [Micromonospora mirobrigensis]
MRPTTALLPLTLAVALGGLVPTGPAQAATAGPALAVDATAGRHPISPYIYGMNFADEALARDIRLPVHRYGGNATTRYNFRADTTNRASDWYFENIPNDNADPASLPRGSEGDRFVAGNKATGAATIMTVPLLGWVAKDRGRACGFSVAKYGPQQSTDPWSPDCGNGRKPDGTPITGNDPTDTSVAAGPEYVTDLVNHLKGEFGSAADGGVQFYNLDNEPDLWHATHRDVRPTGLGYDELRDRTYRYAAAIKAADPRALTLGPVGWGLNSIFYSGLDQDTCGRTGCWSNPPDRAAHGGQDLGPWYLDRMREYEQQYGTRILDYFDIHLYPQQSGVSAEAAGDAATQALRLRSTRQLWDPTYVDESWINQPVRFVPRMRELVDQHYPGTKIAMTEYSWGGFGSLNGALAEADVLGILGREGVDLASLWTAPKADQPVANAFRIYRNYDGAGGAFGETSLRATSADQGKLAVYAAERGADKALTLVVVNKSGDDLTSPVALTGASAGTARVYRYSAANLAGVVREADQQVGPTGFTATFPANSITHLVLPRGATSGDTTPPSAPGRPTAGTVTGDSVALSWSPSTDDTGVTGYDVHRVDATGPVKVGSATGTSYTVSGLAADTAYTFVVTARDAAGNVSAASPGLTVRTAPVGTPTGGCTVGWTTSSWPGGFTATVTITNTGSTAIDGWKLAFDFPTTTQKLGQGWSATWKQSGATVTAQNLSWNGRLAPGASTGIGFNGTWSGSNPAPAAFTLNGQRCG